jgi:hypothetical protein
LRRRSRDQWWLSVSEMNSGYSQDIPTHFSGLHLTAYFGIIAATITILEMGETYLMKEGRRGRSPKATMQW